MSVRGAPRDGAPELEITLNAAPRALYRDNVGVTMPVPIDTANLDVRVGDGARRQSGADVPRAPREAGRV